MRAARRGTSGRIPLAALGDRREFPRQTIRAHPAIWRRCRSRQAVSCPRRSRDSPRRRLYVEQPVLPARPPRRGNGDVRHARMPPKVPAHTLRCRPEATVHAGQAQAIRATWPRTFCFRCARPACSSYRQGLDNARRVRHLIASTVRVGQMADVFRPENIACGRLRKCAAIQPATRSLRLNLTIGQICRRRTSAIGDVVRHANPIHVDCQGGFDRIFAEGRPQNARLSALRYSAIFRRRRGGSTMDARKLRE